MFPLLIEVTEDSPFDKKKRRRKDVQRVWGTETKGPVSDSKIKRMRHMKYTPLRDFLVTLPD